MLRLYTEVLGFTTARTPCAADATVLQSRIRQAFVAQRRADASASAAEAGAAGWVLYWSSLVTA